MLNKFSIFSSGGYFVLQSVYSASDEVKLESNNLSTALRLKTNLYVSLISI